MFSDFKSDWMFKFYFTRSIKFLCSAVFIFSSGCAQKSELAELSVYEQPLVTDKRPVVRISKPNGFTDKDNIQSPKATEVKKIWSRIFNQFVLQDIDNKRIDKEIRRHLKHPKFLATLQQRAQPYLYLITEAVEANNLPGEIVLLPAVESAFKPYAYSQGRAAGLWQFIPSTGRYFGLQQNWWYDGRRDVHTSTQAATRYLRELNVRFNGDWLLALAAYNAGKGTVAKAIKHNRRRNKPTDYWSLNLPKETMDYVPRLLALAKLFANADEYNIALLDIANKPVFELVDIGSQLRLTKAAALADMPVNELARINSGLNRWCTAPDGPHHLLLPVAKAETFRAGLDILPDSERVSWKQHKIRAGENLGLIAKKYKTSITAIKQVNQLAGNHIYAGKHLLIPSTNIGEIHPFFLEKYPYLAKHSPSAQSYTVRPGDSLWSIARKFSISIQKLARWNRIGLKDVLKPGQKLVISQRRRLTIAQSSPANSLQRINYTVRKGDSLSLISRKFNVTVTSLRKWNSLGKYLRPGQKLKVIVDITRPTT